jgi:hypothetical protein
MALDLAAVRRFSRQIALPDLGSDGQERLLAAEVALVGEGLALETAARYLSGAGVGRLRPLRGERDGPGWVRALEGCALVMRAGFDDDPLLRACVRLGIPLIAMRATAQGWDVLSFRHQGPCPHAALEVPVRAAAEGEDPASAVVAGTVAAAEAAWRLARPEDPPRARHLRLGEGVPLAQEIPWAPECFLCGGHGREAAIP